MHKFHPKSVSNFIVYNSFCFSLVLIFDTRNLNWSEISHHDIYSHVPEHFLSYDLVISFCKISSHIFCQFLVCSSISVGSFVDIINLIYLVYYFYYQIVLLIAKKQLMRWTNNFQNGKNICKTYIWYIISNNGCQSCS